MVSGAQHSEGTMHLSYDSASKISIHTYTTYDGRLHAQTHREASFLISRKTSLRQGLAFTFSFKSLHHLQHLIIHKEWSQERKGIMWWWWASTQRRNDCGNEKSSAYKQTGGHRTYVSPFVNRGCFDRFGLICIMPDYQNNPPQTLPNVTSSMKIHQSWAIPSLIPLKLFKRGKEGVREKCRSNVRLTYWLSATCKTKTTAQFVPQLHKMTSLLQYPPCEKIQQMLRNVLLDQCNLYQIGEGWGLWLNYSSRTLAH